MHIWNTQLFISIASKFGCFIKVDEPTSNMARLDIARVQVAIPISETINTLIQIQAKGCHLPDQNLRR